MNMLSTVLRRCLISTYPRSAEIIADYGKSPLYVTHDKRQKVEMFLLPDADIVQRLDAEDVRANLLARKMTVVAESFNEKLLRQGVDYMAWIESEMAKTEARSAEIKEEISVLKEKESSSNLTTREEAALNDLIEEGRDLRKELKNLNIDKNKIEDKIMPLFLDLPNVLHESCPKGDEDEVLFEGGPSPQIVLPEELPLKSHMELFGDQIELSSNSHGAFYLLGQMAYEELNTIQKAELQLQRNKFNASSNPDFVKSLILDGCAEDFADPNEEFTLREIAKEFKGLGTGQGMHLVGGASLYAFAAFMCKNVVVVNKALPLNFYATGRRYKPCPSHEVVDLFTTQQSTAVHCFSFDLHDPMNENVHTHAFSTFKGFYERLGLTYRITAKAACRLSPAESSRVAFELWCPSKQTYMEVGHLSRYGDFLSKRMMFKAKSEDGCFYNLNVVSGQLIDVTKAIACAVEQKSK